MFNGRVTYLSLAQCLVLSIFLTACGVKVPLVEAVAV